MSPRPRSPEEIRSSIEQTRTELVRSVESLRTDVVRLTDWRGYMERNREQIVTAGAVVGFIVGGALVLRGLRRRR